jgi:hypothetical protein
MVDHDNVAGDSWSLTDAVRDATFDFNAKLIDPDFADALEAAGAQDIQDIVVALDEEKLSAVLRRVMACEAGPTIVAVKLDTEKSGFGIMTLIMMDGPPPDGATPVGRESTIGMLFEYAKAQTHGVQIPNGFRVPHSQYAVTAAA